MKKIFTLCLLVVTTFLTQESKAQFSEDFETDSTVLKGNCWQFDKMDWTDNLTYVINGIGSIVSHPTSASPKRDMITPALDVISTSLTLSFNYKLSTNLIGSSTRIIEIGIQDPSNNYTALDTVTLDNSSPITTQSYSNTFTVTTGLRKLVLKASGSNGGAARLLIDDFYTDASSHYSPGTFCNSAPVAVADLFNGMIGNPVFGNVLGNDSDADGEAMTSSIILTSLDGVVVLNPDGSFSFTPNINFLGTTTTFTYRLTDNGFDPLNSNIAIVTINLSAAAPLPVHLVSFQGNMNKNNKVTLQWKVAENKTVSHFEVQRSANGRDFTTVSNVLASEKTDVENYMYFETVNSTDKVMYRLRMIDKKQEASYSKILVFQNKSANNSNQIKIFSNPVIDKLTFSFTSSSTQTVDVKVYDMTGRMQLNQKLTSYEGSNIVSLPFSSTFTPGFYIVEVNDGTERQISKFVKQ